ncbi:MAG: winged helix-turn-helix domain-containing protein [Spirochaetales bacterium]|nr:winged helix-turn-helix domain-containing protein [Spirochaetales bacterium]
MPDPQKEWTFFSNHTHVLFCLAKSPEIPLRLVAQQIGITERAVQLIVADLEEAGVLRRTRVGRQNRYELDFSVSLRHPIEKHVTIGAILEPLLRNAPSS